MNDADAAANNADAQAAFAKLQLAVASVLANPSLGDVLGELDKSRASRSAGDDLTDTFGTNGAPLPKDVKAALKPGEDAQAVTLSVCIGWNGKAHCAEITLRPPIVITTETVNT